MSPELQQIVNDLAAAIRADEDKDALIATLQNPPLTLIALEQSPWWELLWGVGRSKPINNPPQHGSATFSIGKPGQPSVLDFHPLALPTKESDNLYCLRRLASYVPLERLQKARKFTMSYWLQVSDISAVQAVESDYQLQLGQSLWNMGLQFIPWTLNADPAKATFNIRAFNYQKSSWVATGLSIPASFLLSGMTVLAEFSITDTSETHESLTINGNRKLLGISQPVVSRSNSVNEFNIAFQADATADAKSYRLSVQNVSVSLA